MHSLVSYNLSEKKGHYHRKEGEFCTEGIQYAVLQTSVYITMFKAHTGTS